MDWTSWSISTRDKTSLFIKKIIGSSSNVVGLAMHEIHNIVKKEFRLNLIQIE